MSFAIVWTLWNRIGMPFMKRSLPVVIGILCTCITRGDLGVRILRLLSSSILVSAKINNFRKDTLSTKNLRASGYHGSNFAILNTF